MLAAICSFILWKLVAFVVGTIIVLLIPLLIVGIFFCVCDDKNWYEWDVIPTSAKAITAVCLVLMGIPWIDWTWNSRVIEMAQGTVTESWEKHLESRKPVKDPVQENVRTELRRYFLVDWNPPKHFYVTLKDVKTGQLYEGKYVSKHCNNHHQLKRGEEYNIQVTTYNWSNRPDERVMEFNNLYDSFCGS